MQQIAQLFLILLMGYAVVKTGLLKASDSKVLSVVFVYLVMPCVVLNAFQIKDTPEIRTGLLYSMGIAVGMHVVFLLLNALFRKALKLDAVEQVNIIYSNAAALVIPIVQALLGEEYVVYSCAFVIVQLVLLWTHASACLQGSARLEWRKLLTNVNLIAIAAGALLYLLHISLPAPITSTLSSVGNMIGPMGMLLAGMAIAEVPLKKVFCTPRNYLPVFLRLLGVPLVIVLLLWAVQASHWIPDGKSILMTVYLSAITPACATVTSMAQLYDRDASHSSAIYVLSTLLSILTMPLMIGLFELFKQNTKKAARHRSRAAFTITRMCLYETQTIHSAGNGPHRSRCAGRCLRLLCSAGCAVSRLHRPAHAGDPVFPDDGHGRAAAAGLF